MAYQDLSSAAGERAVGLPLGAFDAPAALRWPEHPSGLVLLAQALGSPPGRVELSVARELQRAGLATLHLDLLPPRAARGALSEPGILAARLLAATDWALAQPELWGLTIGYLATGAAAAAALRAAGLAERPIQAVVCVGGRPDRAGDALDGLTAPTLLMVPSGDEDALEPNRRALRRLDCVKRLVVIEASRQLEEPESLDEVGRRAAGWLVEHLALVPRWRWSQSAGGRGAPGRVDRESNSLAQARS